MAIVYGTSYGSSSTTNGSPVSPQTVPNVNIALGDCVIVEIGDSGPAGTLETITGVTDDAGGNVYVLIAGPVTSAAGFTRSVMYACLSATFDLVNATISVAFTPNSSRSLDIVVTTRQGVAAFGSIATATANSALESLSIVTQDNNNVVAGFFSTDLAGIANFTGGAGTLRRSQETISAVDNLSMEIDNTSATPASVTVSRDIGLGGANWTGVAVELRSVGGAAPSTIPNQKTRRASTQQRAA